MITKNESAIVGLFQGLFEKNTLTFNPGRDGNAQLVPRFEDIRESQRQLKGQGLQFSSEADESTSGPSSFMMMVPDGNPILLDQHVPPP